jgi:hypothetical protein
MTSSKSLKVWAKIDSIVSAKNRSPLNTGMPTLTRGQPHVTIGWLRFPLELASIFVVSSVKSAYPVGHSRKHKFIERLYVGLFTCSHGRKNGYVRCIWFSWHPAFDFQSNPKGDDSVHRNFATASTALVSVQYFHRPERRLRLTALEANSPHSNLPNQQACSQKEYLWTFAKSLLFIEVRPDRPAGRSQGALGIPKCGNRFPRACSMTHVMSPQHARWHARRKNLTCRESPGRVSSGVRWHRLRICCPHLSSNYFFGPRTLIFRRRTRFLDSEKH